MTTINPKKIIFIELNGMLLYTLPAPNNFDLLPATVYFVHLGNMSIEQAKKKIQDKFDRDIMGIALGGEHD